MLRPSKAKIAAGAVLVAAGTLFGAAQANAKAAKVKSMDFTTQSLFNEAFHVVSTDMNTWNKIESGYVNFSGHMSIDTKYPGYVSSVGVVLGDCSGSYCKSAPFLYTQAVVKRDFEKQQNFAIQSNILDDAYGAGVQLVSYQKQIIDKCNQHLSANGPTKKHVFDHTMSVTFVTDTDRKGGSLKNVATAVDENGEAVVGAISHSKTRSVQVRVVCEPVFAPGSEDLVDDQPPMKLDSLKLFMSTFSHAVTHPAAGVECKKGRILIRARTNKAGPIQLKLWTKVGDGALQSETIDAWSSFKGNGVYQVEVTKWVSVSGTKNIKARVEDLVTKPVGKHAGWKDLLLKCSNPGGGGWANQPVDNDNEVAKPQAERLELHLKKLEAAKKRKAAKLKKRREAARKAAELKKRRDAAKKAAEIRKHREAARKALELRKRRDAAKKRRLQQTETTNRLVLPAEKKRKRKKRRIN